MSMLRLTRRALSTLLLAGLAAPRPAVAQSAVVRAPPPPCADRPGDIVGLLLEGTGNPAGTVAVFGQAFRPGDLPRGVGLAARLADGRGVPVQADIQTRHADGSALFAVVALAAPALRTGERVGVVLQRGGAPAAALDVVAAAAGRAAVLEIAPAEGGTPWQVDLLLRAQDLLLQRQPDAIWQFGPLAAQARIQAPVPPAAVGGARSARLVADVALRADGTLWVDAWVRNDIAMQPGGGPVHYTLRLLLDGRPALQVGPLRQAQYTGFGRLVGTSRSGPAPQPCLVRHDVEYLAATGAVAPYDLSIGVAEEVLREAARLLADPTWTVPLSPRGITQDMGRTGNRPDIGPTTLWQAAWLVSGDRRAAEVSLGQAEADGAIPWHFWDPSGGADGRGGWIDTRRWPGFWIDRRAGRPPRTLAQPMPTDTGWDPNRSHQPDLSYVPYLLTGRRAFLDGLTSQGVWGILASYPPGRAEAAGFPRVHDLNVIGQSQVRSAAWSLRTLDNAAWIAPDADPGAPFLRLAAAANWGWMHAQIPAWTARQGEAHGWIDTGIGVGRDGDLAPWQQDFIAYAVAMAARRGNADARAVLAWMSNFTVGRFLAGPKGFNPRDGVAHAIAAFEPGTAKPYQSWAEIGARTAAKGWSNGNSGWPQSQGYYGRLGLMSLALSIDVLDSEAARQAYQWLVAAAPPFTGPLNLAHEPAMNIAPVGRPRLPDRRIRCAPARA